MAKEVAFLKRAKISEAQQYVILAVLGAAMFLGAAVSLVMYFASKISFNIDVIAEEERAIVEYSDTIKKIGICRAPKGVVYTDNELRSCTPDNIDATSVPGTLRSNILEIMAANQALNSVPKENNSSCINPVSNKAYTYAEMQEFYNSADTSEKRVAASKLIKSCSALRIIPDALPSTKNEEALLASLNKIFIISDWIPDSLSPSNSGISTSGNLNQIPVSFSVEADSAKTMSILSNIEHSIREFNFTRGTVEWSAGALKLNLIANAYYTDKTTLSEINKNVKPGGIISSTNKGGKK